MWGVRAAQSGPIGLIAGAGEFPILFAKAAMSSKQPVIVFGVEKLTDRRVEDFTSEAHYVGLGELGRLVGLLREKKIKNVVLAGGIPKKQIYNPDFKMDSTAKGFIEGTANKGDDHILRKLELFLKLKCGARVMDARSILKDTLASRGVMTRRRPTEAEWKDLRFGFRVSKHVGRMDIGQTVIVKNGVVVAVEALEGTDEAIRRAGKLAGGGVVVVKTSKPIQSLRFDLPCVGSDTIQTLASAGSAVLGVEAGRTILISKDKFIENCDRAGVAVVGF